jgi:hypothetical protein
MTEANPKRRWFRFSLRALFLLVFVVAVGSGFFAFKLQQARQQRQVIAAIESLGGSVAYDFDFHPWEYQRRPDWLVNLLGVDFFHQVARVKINSPTFTDVDMEQLRNQLSQLPLLAQLDVSQTQITERGLRHLEELARLEYLGIGQTQVRDEGLDILRQMPKLQTLYLAGAKITDNTLQHLKAIPHLKTLALIDTQVTRAGINELQKAVCVQVKMTNNGVTKLISP